MKKIILALLISVSLVSQAQIGQEAIYASYPFLPLTINPAYAGSREVISFAATYRSRGLFVPNAPASSQFFAFDMATKNNRGGIGLVAFNDPSDYTGNTFGAYGSYAHRIFLPRGTLSIGLQLGITQSRIYTTYSTNTAKFNLGLGVYYKTSSFFAGISSPYLTDNGGVFATSKPVFVQVGYTIPIAEETELKVGTVVKKYMDSDWANAHNANKFYVDLNATIWFNKTVGLGVWYMNSGSEVYEQSILGSIEFQVSERFRASYAYDFKAPTINSTGTTTTTIGTINGLHQFMLRFDTNFDLLKKIDERENGGSKKGKGRKTVRAE